MSSILQFKRVAQKLNLCDKYRSKWDQCQSTADLIKLATCAEGAVMVADSFAFGWQPMSIADIKRDFGDYINGGYIVKQEGYTSSAYFGVKNTTITANTTLLLLIDCECRVVVPKGFICRIFTTGGSIVIDNNDGQGIAEVEIFGEDNISMTCTHNVKIIDHKTSEWRKN